MGVAKPVYARLKGDAEASEVTLSRGDSFAFLGAGRFTRKQNHNCFECKIASSGAGGWLVHADDAVSQVDRAVKAGELVARFVDANKVDVKHALFGHSCSASTKRKFLDGQH